MPLTYTLTVKACLSARPADRPAFSQLLTLLADMVNEVAQGRYVNSEGRAQVPPLWLFMLHQRLLCFSSVMSDGTIVVLQRMIQLSNTDGLIRYICRLQKCPCYARFP